MGSGGLRLTEAQLNVMREAAIGGYPEEVCGILVGREENGAGVITRVVPTANASEADRRRRYEIPPADLVREQRLAREAGLRILGFYHSHPDHQPAPSPHDLELAWPAYVYVIVTVRKQTTERPKGWRLNPDRSAFDEVDLTVPDGAIRWA
jgi:proteasome lid subunit RPN8/RPN11